MTMMKNNAERECRILSQCLGEIPRHRIQDGTVTHSEGKQGTCCCHLVLGLDLYNHSVTGEVSMTLCGVRPDCHKIPCVLIGRRTENDTNSVGCAE